MQILSARRENFLDLIKDLVSDGNRSGTSGLEVYTTGNLPAGTNALYTAEEAAALIAKKVTSRMKVKISGHYNQLATGHVDEDGRTIPASVAIRNLVTAKDEEVADLSGQADPSNQKNYMPVDGLLHKYEMALLYVAKTCSAHCRYCYRSDLLAKNPSDSGKKMANIADVVRYITEHNSACKNNNGIHPKTGQPTLREVLLSGGDPMVLSNKKLAEWLSVLAEAPEVTRIRIGTKELAFFPYRFDRAFFRMLDAFHEAYPHVSLTFATHFTHPDEFLKRDETGNYIEGENGKLQWMKITDRAVHGLLERRNFITLENQTPIIRGVNDNPKDLHILQRELYNRGVGNHYFFQGRMIIGYKNFSVPVEETVEIFKESRKGLSGVQKHAVLAMSTSIGKIEIVGVTQATEALPKSIIFKVARAPGDAHTQDSIIIAKSDPSAMWFRDYVERGLVYHDPDKILDTYKHTAAKLERA